MQIACKRLFSARWLIAARSPKPYLVKSQSASASSASNPRTMGSRRKFRREDSDDRSASLYQFGVVTFPVSTMTCSMIFREFLLYWLHDSMNLTSVAKFQHSRKELQIEFSQKKSMNVELTKKDLQVPMKAKRTLETSSIMCHASFVDPQQSIKLWEIVNHSQRVLADRNKVSLCMVCRSDSDSPTHRSKRSRYT